VSDNGVPVRIKRAPHECIDHLRSNGFDGTQYWYRCLKCGTQYSGQQVDAMHDAALAAEERQ